MCDRYIEGDRWLLIGTRGVGGEWVDGGGRTREVLLGGGGSRGVGCLGIVGYV